VSQAAAILLMVQMTLASIALFVLVDGPEWVRDHIRGIALWTMLIGGIVCTTLTSRWVVTDQGYGAFGILGLVGAAWLFVSFISARDFWKWYSSRRTRVRYLSNRAEDQWLVYDGRRELGPFSNAELIERFSNGEIAPSDYVWKPGMDRWRPVYAAGLQRIADQPVAVPLSDASNHPHSHESGFPTSTGAVPPWMVRTWTQHHPERTRSLRAGQEHVRRPAGGSLDRVRGKLWLKAKRTRRGLR
jgi:hypothetical protein